MNTACVVLCAGKSTRMGTGQQKCLVHILGKPLLGYVVDYYSQYTTNFIFVVGYQARQVIEVVEGFPVDYQIVYQKEPKGIANALLCTRDIVPSKFIVALGDCFMRGWFPISPPFSIGILTEASKETTKQNYLVEVDSSKSYVSRVEEKPEHIGLLDYCGMGIYSFKRWIFNYIEQTPPSSLRNEIEITDVLQTMIDSGELIRPVWFVGDYINVNTPEDITKVEEILKCRI